MTNLSGLDAAVSILDVNNWYEINDPKIQNQLVYKPKSHKEFFLSDEAKFIMDIIVKAPMELLEIKVGGHPLVSKGGNVTKYRLAKYLRVFLNWDKKDINKVFDELENYVKEL